MLTLDWTDKYDDLVCRAFIEGEVRGYISGKPTKIMESGLAHIFFYNDLVYKLYKTHPDKNHFIKGVLAPTKRRRLFQEHDYKINRHFSSSIYKNHHSVDYTNGQVIVKPYDGTTIYCLVEMSRLDFADNFHEQLLRGEVNNDSLFLLGYETAKAIDTCPITVPDEVNWYDLAFERVQLLKQFIDWIPPKYGDLVKEIKVIESLESHLCKHKEEYLSLKGNKLTVNLDNHDENVFFVEGRPHFIDLLPPMSSWWYGLPYANLSNIMVNVETLHSSEGAEEVKKGYLKYFKDEPIPEHSFGFTQSFAYLISIAHFGSVPGKESVTEGYIDRIGDISSWL